MGRGSSVDTGRAGSRRWDGMEWDGRKKAPRRRTMQDLQQKIWQMGTRLRRADLSSVHRVHRVHPTPTPTTHTGTPSRDSSSHRALPPFSLLRNLASRLTDTMGARPASCAMLHLPKDERAVTKPSQTFTPALHGRRFRAAMRPATCDLRPATCDLQPATLLTSNKEQSSNAIPQSRNPSLFASREKRVPDLTWGCMSVRLREQPSSLSIVVHRDDRTPSLTAPKHAPTNAPCCSSSTAGRALAICMPSCNSAQPHGNPADRLTPFDGGPLSFIGTNTTASPEPGEWLRHPTRAAQALYSVTVLPNASFTLRSSRLTHPALEHTFCKVAMLHYYPRFAQSPMLWEKRVDDFGRLQTLRLGRYHIENYAANVQSTKHDIVTARLDFATVLVSIA
ncbi:hypothetical protein PMIN01_04243 [Paraphaeosphaeria minitans]|uniref:Uncharacterized protein n=1 Tax=Paraphaeosphaeria minitans TaxID=565426 RepID=A0A9P6KS96_9PLEO|nr:hypothetical protein PMIN01_04243 [Paraphaeosphaeria minitans]